MHEEYMPLPIKLSLSVSEPMSFEAASVVAAGASLSNGEIDAWKRIWLQEVDCVGKRFKRGAGQSQVRRSEKIKKHLKSNTQFVG
jgi:hypothetical protein